MKKACPGRQIDVAAELTRRAEEILQAQPGPLPGVDADPQRLLHSLRVHQIELELQNEQLRQLQGEVDAALERFADFYDFSPIGFFTLERGGKIARVNLTGARLMGLERGRLIGRRFSAFLAEADRRGFDDYLQGIFADGARQKCELELRAGGEPPRIVQISTAPAPDRSECRAVVVDITEQKQVESALRESERRFRDIAAVSADWIWEVDISGRYTYASEGVRTLLGYEPEEIIGKTAFDLMLPEEAIRVGEIFGAITMRGKPFRALENIVLDSQGGRHVTLTDGTPIFDAAGTLIGYRGVDRDITTQRQAEAALEANRLRYREIVDATDCIVWEVDATTMVTTFVSEQAERLLGYPVEAWKRPDFLPAHLHPDDRDWVLAHVSSCSRLMKPFDFEYRFIAQDGREVWLHDMVTVAAANGLPRWLRGVTVDVTRRRRAEEELVLLTENLEAKVRDRTAQLRKLAAQLTMTEERERRMLAQSLHDNLGQLLAVIKIKLTSLTGAAQDRSIGQVVELVEQADRAARDITQQLSPPILRALGLAPALDWLAEELHRVYGLGVHVDFEDCSQHMPEELRAVLYRSARELLINVAKHAGVADASLNFLSDGDRLVLAVSDSGCGFDPARHFGEWPGHGSFGLRSIHERIVNLGGEVNVDSCPGGGTTVTLTVSRSFANREIGHDPDNASR